MTVREWMARFDGALAAAPARRRVLCEELAAHFADALAAGESEVAVTASAGAPEHVALECSREACLLAVERAVWLLLAGLLALGFLWRLGMVLYPLGQWVAPPRVLYPPHHVGLAAWAATGAAGAAAVLALRSWRLSGHHQAVALAATLVLVAAFALHLVAGNLYVWLRNDIVAGSPSAGAQAALSGAHLLVAALAAAPLVRAARRLRRISPRPRPGPG
jgi:hypothetical protein